MACLGFLAMLAASGCGRLLETADLQGTWIATSIVLTDADDRSQSVDVVAEANVFLTLTFELNMYSAMLQNVSGEEEDYAGECRREQGDQE